MKTDELKSTVEKMVDLLDAASVGERADSRVGFIKSPKRETDTERISPSPMQCLKPYS